MRVEASSSTHPFAPPLYAHTSPHLPISSFSTRVQASSSTHPFTPPLYAHPFLPFSRLCLISRASAIIDFLLFFSSVLTPSFSSLLHDFAVWPSGLPRQRVRHVHSGGQRRLSGAQAIKDQPRTH